MDAPVVITPSLAVQGNTGLRALDHATERRQALEAVLSSDEQMTVCEMLARFRPPREILATLRRQGNTHATPQTIHYYTRSPKWQPLIQRLQDEYLANIREVAIANTRVRMDALQIQFEAVREGHSPLRRAEAREILKQAQSEMNDRRTGAITLMTQLMSIPEEELEKRRAEVLTRIKRLGGHTNGVRSQEPPAGNGSPHAEAPEQDAHDTHEGTGVPIPQGT